MKPSSVLSAAVAPSPTLPLHVTVACKDTARENKPSASELRGVQEVCIGLLRKIDAHGNWQANIKGNKNAQKYKSMKEGSAKVAQIINGRQVLLNVRTPDGDLREVVLSGTLTSQEMMDTCVEKLGEDRVFTLKPDKPAPEIIVFVPGPTPDSEEDEEMPFSNDDIILLLLQVQSEGGSIATESCLEFCRSIGGQELIDHCLELALIKEGEEAYAITENGRRFLPAEAPPQPESEPEAQKPQPQSLTFEAVLKLAKDARATLDEMPAIQQRVAQFTQQREEGRRDVNRQWELIDGLEQQLAIARRGLEEKQARVASATEELQAAEEELGHPRFAKAQEDLEKLAELKKLL